MEELFGVRVRVRDAGRACGKPRKDAIFRMAHLHLMGVLSTRLLRDNESVLDR